MQHRDTPVGQVPALPKRDETSRLRPQPPRNGDRRPLRPLHIQAACELQLIRIWAAYCPTSFMPMLADRARAMATRRGAGRAAAALLARQLRRACADAHTQGRLAAEAAHTINPPHAARA